jgi:hypothetical protein
MGSLMRYGRFLRGVRYAFGMEELEFVNKNIIDRKSIQRFARHLDQLDLDITTVIEAGKSGIPYIRAHRFFPRNHYMYFNLTDKHPAFNFYNPDAVIQSQNDGEINFSKNTSLHGSCEAYGFSSPYLLFTDIECFQNEQFSNLLKPAINKSAIVILAIDHNSLANVLDSCSVADENLRSGGFMLYDVLEMKEEKNIHGHLCLFVYVKRDNKLLDCYYRVPAFTYSVTSEVDSVQRNCLILGMGRSGTSMLSGMLYQAGYYMGERLYPGRETNPKGFFECLTVNYINEKILEENGKLEKLCRGKDSIPSEYNPDHKRGQGWLSCFPEDKKLQCTNSSVLEKIHALTDRKPFCYKDPRFSYTLPVWARFLDEDTVFICVFREPGKTINSILAECRRMPYLKGLKINKWIAYEVYEKMYSHVMRYDRVLDGRMLFVHYNQILSREGADAISRHLNIKITDEFVDRQLDRSQNDEKQPSSVSDIYKVLCTRAAYG